MSIDASASVKTESRFERNAASQEHNNETLEGDQRKKRVDKVNKLENYQKYVNNLDFKKLGEEELCLLYRNHAKNHPIKAKIESFTNFIESCATKEPHPQVKDQWDIHAEELKRDILTALEFEINTNLVGMMSYRENSDELFITQSREKIQTLIDIKYPGISAPISMEFMSRSGEVYIQFRDHLRDSLSQDRKMAERRGKPDPFQEELRKFVSLEEETQVLVLYLFDIGIRFDNIIALDTSGYLAGSLNGLFFNTDQYNAFIQKRVSRVDIRKQDLGDMAKEIVNDYAPSLSNNFKQDFYVYLYNLNTDAKNLNESIFQPEISKLRVQIRHKVKEIQQAKVNKARVHALVN